MKTTLGDLLSRGHHIGTGTEFFVNDKGERFFLPLHSFKIVQGGKIVGEVCGYCFDCQEFKPMSQMFSACYPRERGDRHLAGTCVECHKGQTAERGGKCWPDCPVCHSEAA